MRAAVRCVGCLVALALLQPASSLAADPVAFLSASGTCNSSPGYTLWSTAAVGSAHDDIIVGYQAQGAADFSSDTADSASMVGPDKFWGNATPLNAGDSEEGEVDCGSSTPFNVNFYDTPTSPTTFSGATSFGSFDSRLFFIAPGEAQYVADLTLSGGTLRLDAGGGRSQTFASSGEFQLATLRPGDQRIDVSAEEGPQAQWTIAIRALPVTLSAVSFSPAVIAPGEIGHLRYTTSGDTSVTVGIDNEAGRLVRTLATNYPVTRGQHTLTWDGRAENGNPLQDGLYTAHIVTHDPSGASQTGQAKLVIDRPPDTSWVKHPPETTHKQKVKFAFRSDDPTAGFECKYSSGWKSCTSPQKLRLSPGRYSFEVRARDRFGVTDPTPAKWRFRITP